MTTDPAARSTPEFYIEPAAARLIFNVANSVLLVVMAAATALALIAPDALQAMLAALSVPSLIPRLVIQSSAANIEALRSIGRVEIGTGLSGIRQVAIVIGIMYIPFIVVLFWLCRHKVRLPKSMTRKWAVTLAILCFLLAVYILFSFDVFIVGDGSAPAVVPLHVALFVFGLTFCGIYGALPICILPFIVRQAKRTFFIIRWNK